MRAEENDRLKAEASREDRDDRDGVEFLYAIENPGQASSIESFKIDHDTGALTQLSPAMGAGNNAKEVVADQESKFLFVGNSRDCCLPGAPSSVTSFRIDASGELTLASQINLPNNSDTINGMALDRTGTDLYTGSMLVMIEGSVSSLLIDRGSGNMSVLEPDPLNTRMPGRLVMHPNGRFVYAAVLVRHHRGDAGGFDLYLRDPHTGRLTYTGQQFPGGPFFTFYGESVIAAHGRSLVAIGQDFFPIATVFSVNAATGGLTIASQLAGSFKGVAADRTGRFVILTDANGGVTSYRVHKDGSLTLAGATTAVANVSNVVIDNGNKFVYVESPATRQIFAYTFDKDTGALGPIAGSPFTTIGKPIRMTIAAPKSETERDYTVTSSRAATLEFLSSRNHPVRDGCGLRIAGRLRKQRPSQGPQERHDKSARRSRI